jgi:hypothetical protein
MHGINTEALDRVEVWEPEKYQVAYPMLAGDLGVHLL